MIPESPDQEDLRGLEWHHLWRKYQGEEYRWRGHAGAVTAVACSGDGKWLASGSADKTIKIWDAVSGKELRTLAGHTERVTSIAWSADSRLLVSASADKTVKVWGVAKGELVYSLEKHTGRVNSVAFSSDGQHLASASDDSTLRIWNASTGQLIHEFSEPGREIMSLAFDRDGKRVACVSSKAADPITSTKLKNAVGAKTTVSVRNITTGELGAAIQADGAPVCVMFCPQGKCLAVGTNLVQKDFKENRPTGRVTLFDLDTKAAVRSFKQPEGSLTQAAFSPDGKELALSNLNRTVTVWDSALGNQLTTHYANSAVLSVAYSPDGSRTIAGSLDRLLMIWTRPDREAKNLPHTGNSVIHVVFDAVGSRIAASGNHDGTFVWEVKSGKLLATLTGGSGHSRIAWNPTNNDIAGLSRLELRDATTGNPRITLKPPENEKWPNRMHGHAFSADGKLLAMANLENLAGIWDTSTGNCIRTFKMPLWASCVAFSPDSKFLATGSAHGTNLPRGVIKVWNIATGQEAFSLGDEIEEGVWSIAFSPNGELLAASTGHHHSQPGSNTGEIWVWNVQTRTVLYTLRGHGCAVWQLTFSPDGKRLASASGPQPMTGKGPGEVKIWDLTTGESLWTLFEPRSIYGVAFSPDGRRLDYAGGFIVNVLDGTPLAETPTYQPLPDAP